MSRISALQSHEAQVCMCKSEIPIDNLLCCIRFYIMDYITVYSPFREPELNRQPFLHQGSFCDHSAIYSHSVNRNQTGIRFDIMDYITMGYTTRHPPACKAAATTGR
jgi:hypothetical protein